MYVLDFVRTLFGIRKKRMPLAVGSRPQTGATIVRRDLKMTVTHAIDSELWDWLLLSGWRVNSVRNERRRFTSLRADALACLIAAGSEKRARIHTQLINEASKNKKTPNQYPKN